MKCLTALCVVTVWVLAVVGWDLLIREKLELPSALESYRWAALRFVELTAFELKSRLHGEQQTEQASAAMDGISLIFVTGDAPQNKVLYEERNAPGAFAVRRHKGRVYCYRAGVPSLAAMNVEGQSYYHIHCSVEQDGQVDLHTMEQRPRIWNGQAQ